MTEHALPRIGGAKPGDNFTGDEDWLADLDDAGERLHPFDAPRPLD